MDKVAELIKSGKIREIADMRDETDLSGLKLTIDLKQYFAGYNQQPVFTLENSIQPQEGKMKLNKKGILTISLNKKAADCLIDIKVKATDKDQVASLQRTFHIAITRIPTRTECQTGGRK